MTHIETAAHVNSNGFGLGYYLKNHTNYFYGMTTVLKLKDDKFQEVGDDLFLWEVSAGEV